MPIIKQDYIKSETKWIQMVAAKGQDQPAQGKNGLPVWYITICVNGMELEFIASEGFHPIPFSQEQALRRITEFEKTMNAENKAYVHSLVEKHLLA